MKPSQERIALQLGIAFDLSAADAAKILKEVAGAIRAIGPSDGKLVQMQEQLFVLVERLADGDVASIDRVVARLPYERSRAAHYVQVACRGWLEQARLDAAIGLRRQASVWVEMESGQVAWETPALSQPLPAPARPTSFEASRRSAVENARRAQQQANRAREQTNHMRQAAQRRAEAAGARPSAMPRAAPPPGGPGDPWLSRILRRAWPGGFKKNAAPLAPPPHLEPQSRARSPAAPAPAGGGLRQPESPGRIRDPGRPEPHSPDRPPAPKAHEYRVWFGTNRQFTGGNADASFSGEYGASVTYGHCDVYVPKSHEIGSLGSTFVDRLISGTDDRLKLSRTSIAPADSFWLQVKSQLESVPLNRRHAVVFIHGYNVSFNAAALRTAQIGVDLGIDGAMAFFSWPSKGDFEAYKADEASIEASEPAIAEFLVNFADRTGATGVHIIAHSMGNRGVLRAVDKIARDAQNRTGIPFANFILAAPDVDARTFMNLANAYARIARRTTLYVSERDRAVALSSWLHDYPRAGYAPPVTVCDGIDTISVSNIDLTLLGHSYVGAAREVLGDMHSLIFKNEPPCDRFGIKTATTDAGQPYWVVGR